LVLENSGSVARDHLAGERTYLAYVRTSLAIASTGIALVQLLTISADAYSRGQLMLEPKSMSIQKYAKSFGATMIIFSIFILIVGVMRYFEIQHALTLNRFPVAQLLIITTSITLAVLVVVVFTILVTV
ncbi:hypothetical protein GYMLUDRAFT_135130, partial [Collybiopsis luxurians FD-317 M1]